MALPIAHTTSRLTRPQVRFNLAAVNYSTPPVLKIRRIISRLSPMPRTGQRSLSTGPILPDLYQGMLISFLCHEFSLMNAQGRAVHLRGLYLPQIRILSSITATGHSRQIRMARSRARTIPRRTTRRRQRQHPSHSVSKVPGLP